MYKTLIKETINGNIVHFFFISTFGDEKNVHTINFGFFNERGQVKLFCSVDTSVSTGDLKTVQKFLNKYFNNNIPQEINLILGEIIYEQRIRSFS